MTNCRRKRVRSILHEHKALLSLLFLGFVTILIILPVVCRDWYYSIYFSGNRNDVELVRRALKVNDARREQAELYLHQALIRNNATARPGQYIHRPSGGAIPSRDHHVMKNPDIAIGIVTINRQPEGVKPGEEYGYLTQTAAGIHAEIQHNTKFRGIRLFVCDVDAGSDGHTEAVYVSKVVQHVARFNSSEMKALYLETPRSVFDKEKDDYVFCLERALQYRPKYVLLLEDDAIPTGNLFSTLHYLLNNYVLATGHHRDAVTKGDPWLFLKLYYPDKWSGFSRDLLSVTELLAIGLLGGTVITVLIILLTILPILLRIGSVPPGVTLPHAQTTSAYFVTGAIFSVLIACAVGRPYLTALRAWSPYLHRVVPAQDCCTQGVLFPAERAREVAEHLNTVTCTIDFSVDIAMDAYAKSKGLLRHLARPNMLKHIGMVSTVRSYAKSAAEFLV